MKYGETLRQRSIPAWSHHNIDYDDVKHLIKEHTTPGNGKTIAIPGKGDEKLVELENSLFHILEDQHDRIDLFVKSKSGEIHRRLDHAKKQLRQLSARNGTAASYRLPISRLERYGRLENDVLKAGDEIRSLARFISAQRTAFRKLLKKFKKWTGSVNLERRFQEDVLESPRSFTKLDLGPLLDDYSQTLQNIRSLFETTNHNDARSETPKSTASIGPSAIEKLNSAFQNGSRVEFDTAMATIPIGEGGAIANYFVHHDNIMELQVLLLQHMEYYASRSRSNSTTNTVPSPSANAGNVSSGEADYFALAADDLNRFAREEGAVTVNEREQLPGLSLQRAKAVARWNDSEEAVLCVRSGKQNVKTVSVRKKHIEEFFDKTAPFPSKKNANAGALRRELLKDGTIQPLYKISSSRSRFKGINNGPKRMILATLDASINLQGPPNSTSNSFNFPFAVLQVRNEGSSSSDLTSILDHHHVVERVRGFSLQYQALYQTCNPANLSPPFWTPILSRDIRKLPPPALKGKATSSGSQSATRQSTSSNSVSGGTDGTTAVETAAQSSTTTIPEQLEAPPLRSFRKKRRRTYAKNASPQEQRYWNEYDGPDEGKDGEDAYVLYFDPNEQSTIDRLLDKLGGLFSTRKAEEDPLLPSPNVEEESSDDEEATDPRVASYGTVMPQISSRSSRRQKPIPLPQITTICFLASLALLIVAYFLATASGHKYIVAADAGIVFAIGCSLLFAVIGCIPVFRRREVGWPTLGIVGAVLVVEAVCSGGLLAWMLG